MFLPFWKGGTKILPFMPSVLIVDDLTAIHEMLGAVIQPTGYTMDFADNGEEALRKYKAESFDVVLADISMQPMDGITLLQQLKAYDPDCVAIMMTGYASTDTAIKALKHGAFDYIQKPFKIDELIQTLKRAVSFGARNHARQPGKSGPVGEVAFDLQSRILGQSERTERLRQQIAKLMTAQTPLLLEGELGTGKKRIAETIHEGSRAEGPFILIDCGLSTESEFRQGLIGESGHGGDWLERAKGGTLFLQHVEKLSLEIQDGLVSVMKRTINETRLICASTQNLEELVDEGAFHDELFYRIATLPIELAPLRDRLEDLPLFIRDFLGKAKNPAYEGVQIEFHPEALEVMKGYYWPGNQVELEQVVTSLASSTTERIITADQLPLRLNPVENWPQLEEYLAEQRARYIRRVMRACGGDKALAAAALGCPVEQLDESV